MHDLKCNNREGSILILTLLCLVILLFFAAVVIDVGVMKVAETELNSAADAAALAAINELGDNQKMYETAKEYAAYHGINGHPIQLTDEQIQIGEWDEATRSFVEDPDGNSVRVVTKATDHATFFGKFFGVHSFSREVDAIATTQPRDILFLVDLSGSMNDDTEPSWAIDAISDTFDGTAFDGVGKQLGQDLFDDFGFGTFPGTKQPYFESLGSTDWKTAYHVATTNDGGLLMASHIPAKYRIVASDSELERKRKAYSWIIDKQIAVTMPAAFPEADSDKNYGYWEKYLDYIARSMYVSDVPRETNNGGSDSDDDLGPAPSLGSLDPLGPFRLGAGQAPFFTTKAAFTPATDDLFPYHRGWLPPSVDNDRLSRMNNPNPASYPSATLKWTLRNHVGYESYVNFMLDFGRDEKPDNKNYTPLSLNSPLCPTHFESINGENFDFPPRTQPMNSVRRSLISALQVVRDRNISFGLTSQRDLVSVMTFDTVANGTSLIQPLTDDYNAAMVACTTMQATSDKGHSTTTEAGLRDAYEYLRSKANGGQGRNGANKVVVLLTDGLPNAFVSPQSVIDQFISDNSEESDIYGDGRYWLDASILQSKRMQADDWTVYPVGIGFGTDYDFMDRIARIGATAIDGQATRGSGNPAIYEETLKEIFHEIITNAKARLVK